MGKITIAINPNFYLSEYDVIYEQPHIETGWSQSIVRQLLDLGANIGVRNWRDEIPLSRISPQTLSGSLCHFKTAKKLDRFKIKIYKYIV